MNTGGRQRAFRDRVVALCCGAHPRVGACSFVRWAPREVLREIACAWLAAIFAAQHDAVLDWLYTTRLVRLTHACIHSATAISLYIPATGSLAKTSKLLADEYGTAMSIRTRVSRKLPLFSLSAAAQELKKYSMLPSNGLIIFCGITIDTEGREKKLILSFEPRVQLNASLYICDNHFATNILEEMELVRTSCGIIVISNTGAEVSTICGSCRKAVKTLACNLGNSLQDSLDDHIQGRKNFLLSALQLANETFSVRQEIRVPEVALGCTSEFYQDLCTPGLIPPSLASLCRVFQVAQGGECGFWQAVKFSRANHLLFQEQELVEEFFRKKEAGNGLAIEGIAGTMQLCERGLVDKLIVSQNCDWWHLLVGVNPPSTGRVIYVPSEKECYEYHDVLSKMRFTEWIAQNYQIYGCTLTLVSAWTAEGRKFLGDTSGVGAILYKPQD
ncbi:eukaryotic peptide chain release factor subunit 1 [Pelomyxa schiedti]|nr:eukaryotic peptide chain release factor subunit 1 [Pelomyxa schiedti]